MHVPFRLALFLAATLGFIALAYEILWMRLFGFASGTRPQAFGALLGFYLLGLALGSLLSRWWQRDEGASGLLRLSRLVLWSNVAGFLVIPIASWLIVQMSWPRIMSLVFVASALMGTLLPLLCHFAIAPDERAGARMSYIYLANIIGSGAGSLITGFVLLDVFKLWQVSALLLCCATLLAFGLARRSRLTQKWDHGSWAIGAALVLAAAPLHDALYERLQYAKNYKPGMRFAQTIESRHGVITITTNRMIFGGGVYDGVIDTELKFGNGIVRPYFVSALHPKPRHVLVVGMSGGGWTQALAQNPEVERVTVVEISDAYLKVLESWPQVSSILTNSKVEIVIDDGRRWLRRNPDRRFDVVVMNTTFHWREFAAALLSKEFLEMVRAHLHSDGFVMWNTTDSVRAARTGMEVFPHTMMVYNNCVGSMAPLQVNKERWRSVLSAYQIDGRPLFDLTSSQGREELERVLAFGAVAPPEHPRWHSMDRAEMTKVFGSAQIITDDNLGDEYGIGLEAFAAVAVPGLKKILFPNL